VKNLMDKRQAKFQLEYNVKCVLNVNFAFKLFVMLLLTGLIAFVPQTTAEQVNDVEDVTHPSITPYPITVAIEQLSTLVTADPQQTEQLLVTFKLATTTLAGTHFVKPTLSDNKGSAHKGSANKINTAEQYLLYLIEAQIKQFYQQHSQAISLLNQAKKLETTITEQQLNAPVFINLYALLAKSYVAVADFEQAYQAKKRYIEKFARYSDEVKEEKIALLTQEYEIANKVEANTLLSQQNEVKTFALAKVKKEQHHQQLLFLLITIGVFIFVVLFLRQLSMAKKLLLLSRTDRLTGIINRATFFVEGKVLLEQMVIEQKELSLMMFTVDCFHDINNDYGHAVGDKVLSKVGHLVAETMRARDLFARLDQDNFVIMLPDTDIHKAKAIAVRVMEKISRYDFTELELELELSQDISLSLGVVNIKDASANFDGLIHAADLARYHAKRQGNNQMMNYATINEKQERRANSK